MNKRKNSGPLFFKPARADDNKPGKSIELQVSIDRLSAEGRGLAYRDSKPLFIANTLPGETVRVRVTSDKRDYAEAELLEIIAPAAQRIAPRCELFGRCGGCQLQMLDTQAQLQHKTATLQHLLQPYFAQSLSDSISAPPWHYRHRARLAVSEYDGKPLLGFKALNSHRVIAVTACTVLDIRLQPLLQQLPLWLVQLTHWRRIDEIRIAIDSAGVIALGCHTLYDLPATDLKLLNDCCVAANIRFGKDSTLTYAVPSQDTSFQFTVDDFTQVNPAVNDQLVMRALQWLRPTANETVADFFCGLGNFALPLAQRAQQVIGYELDAAMVTRATNNAAQYANAEFRQLDLFNAAVQISDRFDAALLDPPRAGAKALCRQLATSQTLRRIVYVSCNPHTLVRDLDSLTKATFRVRAAALVDMFPQTGHIETIVLLER